jgi:hypothetical protein
VSAPPVLPLDLARLNNSFPEIPGILARVARSGRYLLGEEALQFEAA